MGYGEHRGCGGGRSMWRCDEMVTERMVFSERVESMGTRELMMLYEVVKAELAVRQMVDWM